MYKLKEEITNLVPSPRNLLTKLNGIGVLTDFNTTKSPAIRAA